MFSTVSPSIPEFFSGKSIFITGATGFIGKVLIEKILRSCRDVKKIYVLVRPKKGRNAVERIDQIINTPLFDIIRKEDPNFVNKLVAINGNIKDLGLGISPEDRQLLIDDVSMIVHAAASVRFDDALRDAIMVNVRCTREIALLAQEMKNLEVYLHVSTTFCNIDKYVIDEELYPAYGDWREAIEVAEKCDSNTLDILTNKYIQPFPNTYTYTKLLGEHVVNDLCVGRFPTVIVRPSVVVSALHEPIRGWIDNLNGPTGLLLAGGSGILRTVYGDTQQTLDMIPVDSLAKGLIVALWHTAITRDSRNLFIYNASKYKSLPLKCGEFFVNLGKQLYWDIPFENKLWFPGNFMTSNWYIFYINVILFHVIPAVFIDLVLMMIGKKPFLLKLQRKIYIANMALEPFQFTDWSFKNVKFKAIADKLSTADREVFSYDFCDNVTEENYHEYRDEVYNYYKMSCDWARHYLLKESKEIKPETFASTKRLYIFDCTIRYTFFAILLWTVFFKWSILNILYRGIYNYWNSI